MDEPHLLTEDILKIGRDFQFSDTWRGATFDTAKLLCDEIERLNRELCLLKAGIGNASTLYTIVGCIVKALGDKATVSPCAMTSHEFAILRQCRGALEDPPRNCDKYPKFNDAIKAFADEYGYHDNNWNSERYCTLAQWLLAIPYKKGDYN